MRPVQFVAMGSQSSAQMVASFFHSVPGLRIHIQYGGDAHTLTELMRRRPMLLHFIGHADVMHIRTHEPTLGLTRRNGETLSMAPEHLVDIIASQHKSRLQMAFINGCDSDAFCSELNMRAGIKSISPWSDKTSKQSAPRFFLLTFLFLECSD